MKGQKQIERAMELADAALAALPASVVSDILPLVSFSACRKLKTKRKKGKKCVLRGKERLFSYGSKPRLLILMYEYGFPLSDILFFSGLYPSDVFRVLFEHFDFEEQPIAGASHKD